MEIEYKIRKVDREEENVNIGIFICRLHFSVATVKKKFSFIKKIIYTFLQPIIELAYLKEKRKKKLINGC
jgi:hypothetical protein